MEKIKIVTDTASDLTLKQAKEFDIELIPVKISHDGKTYKEEYEISKKKMWKILEESDEIPKTSQITPETFLTTYKRLYSEGYNRIIVVTMNSLGSGTYNNANLAGKMFFEDMPKEDCKFEFIDSTSYTYIYGRPVMLGAQMIKEGKSFLEVTSFLRDRISHMRAYAYMSTLKFAKKSGRISLLSAIIGEALGLKPILRVADGKVDVIAKTRGEKMAISKIIELVKEDAEGIRNDELILVHGSNDKASIEKVKKDAEEKLLPKDIFVGEFGSCISINAGPETIGLLYYGK